MNKFCEKHIHTSLFQQIHSMHFLHNFCSTIYVYFIIFFLLFFFLFYSQTTNWQIENQSMVRIHMHTYTIYIHYITALSTMSMIIWLNDEKKRSMNQMQHNRKSAAQNRHQLHEMFIQFFTENRKLIQIAENIAIIFGVSILSFVVAPFRFIAIKCRWKFKKKMRTFVWCL